jgi:hypothetical protein
MSSLEGSVDSAYLVIHVELSRYNISQAIHRTIVLLVKVRLLLMSIVVVRNSAAAGGTGSTVGSAVSSSDGMSIGSDFSGLPPTGTMTSGNLLPGKGPASAAGSRQSLSTVATSLHLAPR